MLQGIAPSHQLSVLCRPEIEDEVIQKPSCFLAIGLPVKLPDRLFSPVETMYLVFPLKVVLKLNLCAVFGLALGFLPAIFNLLLFT
jgi:hypothetical protein